ncbi:MAG: FecR domain-containing protein [Bacteroidales bacterium]
MMDKKGNNKKNNKEGLFEQHLSKAFSNMSVPRGMGKEAAWEKLVDALEKGKEKKEGNTIRLLNKPFLSVAASVAFIILSASMYYIFFMKVNISAGNAQLVTYTLPDHSQVTLNSGSTLSFKKSRWIKNRFVHLDGEAFFNVLPGSSFTVTTTNGSISVVGTSFNVYSRKSHFIVSCKTGEVRVNVPLGGFMANLEAGKGIKINTGNETLSYEKLEGKSLNSSAWLSGEFYFDNTPLVEVFEEIERQYDIKIYAEGLSHRRYTGYFKKGDLIQTLDVVCLPMNLIYQIKNNKSVYIE